MAGRAQAEYAPEEVPVAVAVEDRRVIHRLPCDVSSQGSEHHCGEPYSGLDRPAAVAREFIARIVEYIIDEEEEYRHHERSAESTFSDDGAQRRTDEEEYDAGHREGILLDELYLMAAYAALLLVHREALELVDVLMLARDAYGLAYQLSGLRRRHGAEHRVDGERARSLGQLLGTLPEVTIP